MAVDTRDLSGVCGNCTPVPWDRATAPQEPEPATAGVEEYETLGQQLYGLAAECPEAAESGLVHPLTLLRDHIIEAKKPLNFIAEHYLGHRRGQLFG